MRYLTTEEIEKALKKIDKVEKDTTAAIADMRADIASFKTEMMAIFTKLQQDFSDFLVRYENEQDKRKTALLELTKNTEEGG